MVIGILSNMPLVGDLSSFPVRRGGDLRSHELLTVAGKTPLSPLEEALLSTESVWQKAIMLLKA